MTKPLYASLQEIVLGAVELLTPAERLNVAAFAAKYRYVKNPGSYTGKWNNAIAPYMIDPMDALTSIYHDAVIMVAPAQCGKTDALIINWALYTVAADPMDMIIVNPTAANSRDFATRRLGRLNKQTPKMAELMSPARDADNKTDKMYRNGVIITLAHPSATELAGKPVPRVAITDLDRMPTDIDGEGSPFDLASKRTTTFGSYKMTLAESSPSYPIKNPHWIPETPHEAPPTEGIFALYNRGDRHRWYWPCPLCDRYFEGQFSMLRYDEKLGDPLKISESVYMECPHCNGRIEQSSRTEMNLYGQWVADGQSFDANGNLVGYPRSTLFRSYWLKGVAAAFVSWKKLVATFRDAESEYDMTKSEEALVKFYNTDLAEPYIPKHMIAERTPEQLIARAYALPERMVPSEVRVLVANVDVQKHSFVVHIHGIAPGQPFDIYLIDRYELRRSERLDELGVPYPLNPASYLDDWNCIENDVMNRSYPLDDESGRRMAIKLTTCDSGGYSRQRGQSVTAMSYDFYRRLKEKGRSSQFMLTRGAGSKRAPRVSINYPEAAKKDSLTAARGDVPVMFFNSDVIKDILHNRLDVVDPTKGMIHFPDWLPVEFFGELCAENRTAAGWVKLAHSKNEAWDLLYYLIGVSLSPLLGVDRIDWSDPKKPWAYEWDKNPLVFMPSNSDNAESVEHVAVKPKGMSLSELGKLIG